MMYGSPLVFRPVRGRGMREGGEREGKGQGCHLIENNECFGSSV